MKQTLNFYLLLLALALPGLCNAQQPANDTFPTKTSVYQVKKKNETILSIANKLKLDPQAIYLLNDSMPLDKVLAAGQNIMIPVNPDNVKQEAKKGRAKNKGNAEPKEDAAPVAKTVYKPLSPPIDTELIEAKILLADATLDLNRALLQGIQASLDSLNVKDKNLIDEKNISVTIHHMQRQRDKAMLTPVLLHMQDSLKTEIKKEEQDMLTYENMLGKNEPLAQKTDTVITTVIIAKDTARLPVVADVPVTADVKDTVAIPVKDNTAPVAKTEDSNKPVIVQDTASVPVAIKADTVEPAQIKPVKKENPVPETGSVARPPVAAIKEDTPEPAHVRPVIEINPSPEARSVAPPPVMHWETAKAIYFNNDTTGDLLSSKVSTDTAGYKPVAKAVENIRHGGVSDSSRIIKAQYYYTRSLKASNEKNYNAAAGYLKTAIDLLPRYYDAWFALGDAETHLGLYSSALNEYRQCKSLDSSNASLYYKIGIVQLKLSKKTEALYDFNKSLKLDSNYIPAIISRAAIYAEKNQLRAAIKEYGRVIKLDPTYHTVYKPKAMAEYDLQNYSAAIDDFTRVLIFNEDDGSVYYYRGMAKLKHNDLLDACTDLSVSAKLGYTPALKALQAGCK